MRITYVPDKSRADGRTLSAVEVMPANGARTSVSILCQCPVNEGDPITADGTIASFNNLSTFGHLLGLALSSASIGFYVEVLLTGRMERSGWQWIEGDSIFLRDLSLSSVVPSTGYLQQVGIADGAHSLIVSIRSPIKL